MIRFHDPRASSAVEPMPYGLGIELTDGTPVAFLANGFPDSVRFLEALAEVLQRRVGIEAHHWNKGDDSILASETILGEIGETCQALVAAYGH